MNKHGWIYKKLGDVCVSDLGKTLNQSKDKGKMYPYLCAVNILWDRIDLSTLKETRFEENELERYSVHKGDLLVCEGGDIGRAAIWNEEKPIQYQNALHRLRFNQSMLSRFCLYHLYHLKMTGELDAKFGKGVTIKHLVKSALLSIPIPVPAIEVQNAIVAELDEINEVIAEMQLQVVDLDELAQSIFYTMFGDPVNNEKGWELKKLGDVCIVERGGSPRPIKDFITTSNDGINWIKIGDATDGSIFINSTKEKIKPEGMKKSRFVHKGDFILSNSMSFGKPYILGVDGCIHDGWLVIHDNNNTFNKYYLYYFLSSKNVNNEFKRLAVGGVVNNLNSSIVRNINICIPPINTQQKFADSIEAIESVKAELNAQIAEMQNLLASRMDYYFD